MKLFKFGLVLLLSGCAAQQIPYAPEPTANKNDAQRIIEQVTMEQPTKYRPQNVLVTDDYIAFDEGYTGKTVGSATAINNTAVGYAVTKGKNVGSRLYFNSLGVPTLYKKRGWFVVQLVDSNDQILKRLYTRDEAKAEALIDSVVFFNIHAKPIK